jgi:hypothetical protein
VSVIALLTRRCAWCDRTFRDGAWSAPVEEGHDPDHETATICPDCAALLQERGLSR